MTYIPNPNRCNDWECEHNKNGECTIDQCPTEEIMLEYLHRDLRRE